MTLIQLQYFQTVCKYNNITRAARALHISQPSLSNAIKELEKEFGLTLFHRHSKGLSLTKDGEVFLQESGQLLEQADFFVKKMHELAETKQSVRLGVPPMLSALIFPRLFQAFRENYPEFDLQLVENGTLANKEALLEGTLDAAIISNDTRLPASFHSYELCSEDIFLYVSGKHPLASKSFVEFEDIADIPLTLLTEDSFLTSFIKQNFKSRHLTPNIILKTNQLAAICQLTENNTAATFLFDHILPADRDIVKIPVNGMPKIYIRLIWNKNQIVSSGLKKMIHLVKDIYPDVSTKIK